MVDDIRPWTGEERRQAVDTRELYENVLATKHELATRFAGSMSWKAVKGHSYLIRKTGRVEHSLGRSSPETLASKLAFDQGREAARSRLDAMEARLDQLSAINRGLDLGRAPALFGRIARALTDDGLMGQGLIVVGANALYAYAAAAGVHFGSGLTATGDLDLLWDARRRLRFVVDDDRKAAPLLTRLAAIDHSFVRRDAQRFRAVNREGYMVDLITPARGMRAAPTIGADDLEPAEIDGLNALVHAPKVDVAIIDEVGLPARLVVPHPLAFAAHKAWVATRADRDPVKRARDMQQAEIVVQLTLDQLPQYTQEDLAALPKEMRDSLAALTASGTQRPRLRGW